MSVVLVDMVPLAEEESRSTAVVGMERNLGLWGMVDPSSSGLVAAVVEPGSLDAAALNGPSRRMTLC